MQQREARIAWAAAAALALLALSSAVLTDRVLLLVRLGLITIATLSFITPQAGLLIVCGLTPLAAAVMPAGVPLSVRLAEAITLAFLSGWLCRVASASPSRNQTRSFASTPTVLFAIAIVASTMVRMATVQAVTDDPIPFAQASWRFLTRDYLLTYASFPSVMDAARLLEGLGLLISVWTLSRDHRSLPVHLYRITLAAAAGAAILSVASLGVDIVSDAASGQTFLSAIRGARLSGQVTDVNAAGSYLAMILMMAVARARAGGRWNVAAIGMGVLLSAALWLSGSRTAMVAAVVSVIALAAWRRMRHEVTSRWIPQAIAAALAIILVLVALGFDPRPPASRSVSNTMSTRAQFVETSLRMLATRPIFGVGIGQYYSLSGRFMPQGIYWFYFHENAHNNFLQIAAELGVIGLALFVWLLGVILWRAWRARARSPAGSDLEGVFFGLVAFMATWLAGHPLLVPEVAYPFWIVLGLALVGGAEGAVTAADPHEARTGDARRHAASLIAMTTGVVLLGSVPFRVARELREFDPTTVNYGMAGPEFEEGGVFFRWIRDGVRLFIPLDARAIEIPFRTDSAHGPVDVEIAFEGRVVNRLHVPQGSWQPVRILMPPAANQGRARRVDLVLIPGAGQNGARPNGEPAVMVGQVKIIK